VHWTYKFVFQVSLQILFETCVLASYEIAVLQSEQVGLMEKPWTYIREVLSSDLDRVTGYPL
jgi:hypothetical protein